MQGRGIWFVACAHLDSIVVSSIVIVLLPKQPVRLLRTIKFQLGHCLLGQPRGGGKQTGEEERESLAGQCFKLEVFEERHFRNHHQ